MGHTSVQTSHGLRPLTEVTPTTGQRVSRVLAETGLSLGVGFAADGIYRGLARSGKGGAALCVGLVTAAGLKAAGAALLATTMGPTQGRTTGQTVLDGVRTGVIDGALAIGARRLHQGVAGRMPNARPLLRTAVTGATMGTLGGAAYATTDATTWQQGVSQGLTTVGKSTAFGAVGGFALGGAAHAVAAKVPGLLRALRRSPTAVEPPVTPAVEPKPVLTETAVTAQTTVKVTTTAETAVSGQTSAGVTTKVETVRPSRLERMQQYQQQALTGSVSPGAATTKLPQTATGVATGNVVTGATPAQTIKPASPAFKGDPYHPKVVENRIAEWQKLYGTATATAPARMTKPQAIAAAEQLGFELTNHTSHGQPVFKNGNRYITPDVDRHNGGVWKMADSPRALGSKTSRLGTYDADLNRIGD